MPEKDDGNRQLVKYAGLAMQFLVSIGIGVFLGLKIDQWLRFSFPLFVWLLPLLIILGMLLNIIRETSRKK
jgi:F0F1-type ATP synthase assembly protein I